MLEVDSSAADDEDDEPADKPEPVKILQSNASFSEITVWGHDMLPAADDPFVKGIEEWIAFAEAIHLQPKRLELPTPIAGSTQVAL
jgi:ribonuclease H2 subunit C